jgi:DNA primase
MLDIQALKANIDLIVLAGNSTDLHKKGAKEYTGPCPFCGGTDRFNVQADKWLCRNCTGGKWADVLTFIARRDNLDLKADFREIVKRAGGDPGAMGTAPQKPKPTKPAYSPPVTDWQQSALEVIDVTRAQLLGDLGGKARKYLTQARGLRPETVDRFGLGYSTGQEIAGLYVPHGIVIPCAVRGEFWYLKVRTTSSEPGKKYAGVKGNRTNALYNADELLFDCPALFVEGEFDCMLAAQEVGDTIVPVTFGANTNTPDLATWGAYLARPNVCLISYDLDEAGEAGAFSLAALLGDRARLAPIPEGAGKDITDYYRANGDLWAWVRDVLAFYDPLPGESAAEYARDLAGILTEISVYEG